MKKKRLPKSLKKMNLNAAGIDIGSTEHYVAVPEDRAVKNIRVFQTFTSDLYELGNWLKECKISTVAMESTGVYWIPLFQILEEMGFEVYLVNAHHVKNVPGRKTDVKDCQWLQELHTYGLLRASFQPESVVRQLRVFMRQRDMLIRYSSSHIQHIQKTLTLMNIKLSNVISDITGETGMGIIRDIVKGEHNPEELIKNCRRGLKNPMDVIKKSLEGNYTEEHVFLLSQNLELYDFYKKKIEACEKEINKLLNTISLNNGSNKVSQDGNTHKLEDLTTNDYLKKITGVDLLAVKGFNTNSLLAIISEVGLDMSKWQTVKHFTSWLGLSPNNKISGGKILHSGTKKTKSYASKAFRLCAQSLSKSHSYLGGFYRRLKSRLGAPKANVATARKLSIIFYTMLKNGIEYNDLGCDYFDERHKERSIKNLKKRAELLGYSIIECST